MTNPELTGELKRKRISYDNDDQQLDLAKLVNNFSESNQKHDFIMHKNNNKTALAVALEKCDGDGIRAVLIFCKEFIGDSYNGVRKSCGITFTKKQFIKLLTECENSNGANILQRCVEIKQMHGSDNSDGLQKKVYGCLSDLGPEIATNFINHKDKKNNTVLHIAAGDEKTGALFLFLAQAEQKKEHHVEHPLTIGNKDLMTPLMVALKKKSILPEDMMLLRIPSPDLLTGMEDPHVLPIAMCAGAEYLLAVVKSLPDEYVEGQFLDQPDSPALELVINKDVCQVMEYLVEMYPDKLRKKLVETEFLVWLRSQTYSNRMRDCILEVIPEERRPAVAGSIPPRSSAKGSMQAIIFWDSEPNSQNDAAKIEKALTQLHFKVRNLPPELWNSSTLPSVISGEILSTCTILLVIGLTHGVEGYLLDDKKEQAKIESIQREIQTRSSHVPKILILDACRVKPEDEPENKTVNDADEDERRDQKQRIVTYRTCSEGEVAHGDWGGSFINQLDQELEKAQGLATNEQPINLIEVLETVRKKVSNLTDRFASIILMPEGTDIGDFCAKVEDILRPLHTCIQIDKIRLFTENRYQPMLNALKDELSYIPVDCTKLMVVGVQRKTSNGKVQHKYIALDDPEDPEKLENELRRIQTDKGYTEPTDYLVDGKYMVTVCSFYVGNWPDPLGPFVSELELINQTYKARVDYEVNSNRDGNLSDVFDIVDGIVYYDILDEYNTERCPRPTQNPDDPDGQEIQQVLLSEQPEQNNK